jgi:hypothetical protein
LQTFDASSLIYAWDNYPPNQFPALWNWFAEQVTSGDFTTPQVAFDEVKVGSPDCTTWLADAGITRHPVTQDVIQEAMRIKSLLGITNDDFHPNGVGENDVLIIATAKLNSAELISNEALQNTAPTNPKKRRIPSVCALSSVGVPCRSFLKLLRASGTVFG